MIAVSVGEAKNRLPYFLHLVEKGETVEVTRHGKSVAFINNCEKSNALSKKEKFFTSLSAWRETYADCLLPNEEIDEIFKRDSSIESDVLYFSDFER